MKQNIYFLKDSGHSEWLVSEFAKRDFLINFIGMPNPGSLLTLSRLKRIKVLHTRYLQMAYKSLVKSKKNDIIICYLDVIGLYVFLLSKLLIKARAIIIINIMFNDRRDLITSFKRFFYKFMLNDPQIFPAVTSSELPAIYREVFNLPEKEFFLVHDCYGKIDNYERIQENLPGYVFCGGTNGRDWSTIKRVATILPHVNFVIVGPQKNTLGDTIPSNIKYYYDVSNYEFQELFLKSTMLAMPLNTEAPAGLIVLFTAGLMYKPVITTDNLTMREYIISGENGILVNMGDFENFAKQIDALFFDNNRKKEFGERLFKRVKELGSPQVFVDNLINIIRKTQVPE